MSTLIQYLRRASLLSGNVDLSDGQLLECFLIQGEEAAIGAIVRRHGPMVWGVCQRVLCNSHDADDAFQATFLVFVRKASSIYPRENVANWLYGVAMKTAKKAKAISVRRKCREKQVRDIPEKSGARQTVWPDLEPVLDQELSRLPKKYRTALVLCELEGKSRKQVARELGLPEGTVAGHLTRGRALLARRLSRYGLAISCVELAMLLTENAASAAVPRSVLLATAKTTVTFATGQVALAGLVSTSVASLAKGVLKAMFITKLKTAASVVLVTAICCGAGSLTHQAWAAKQGSTLEHSVLGDRADGSRADISQISQPATQVAPAPMQEGSRSPLQIDLKHIILYTVWSRDGKWLATGTKDGTVHITDAATGKEIRNFSAGMAVPALAVSPDGKMMAIASAGLDGISFWDTDNGAPAGQVMVRMFGSYQADCFAFSPDGQRLANIQVGGFSAMMINGGPAGGAFGIAGAGGGAVGKAGVIVGKAAGGVGGQGGAAGGAAGQGGAGGQGGAAGGAGGQGGAAGGAAGQGGAGGQGGAAGGAGGQGGAAGGVGKAGGGGVGGAGGQGGAAGGAGGKAGGAGGGGGGGFGGAGAGGINVIRPAAAAKGIAAVAPDGSVGGSCDMNGQLFMWDAKSNTHRSEFNVGNARNLAFIPNRNQVAVATAEGEVHLWDWTQKKKVATLPGTTTLTSRLVCSLDGSTLASISEDKSTITIWDLARNEVRSRINHKAGSIQALALSPDGKMMATAATDGTTLHVRGARAKELNHKGTPVELSDKEVADLWKELGNEDYDRVELAWQKLGSAGDKVVPTLRKNILPIAVPAADLKSIQKLIVDLNSDKFAIREGAVSELVAAGELAILPLQRMLAKPPSPEAATRAELVLKKLAVSQKPNPDRSRVLEAIELLEQLQTAQAVGLLQELERDSLLAQIQNEAHRSLQRIAQSKSKN